MDGLSSPAENCKRAKELGINLLGISDHGVVSGHLDHISAAKKNTLKYCLGTELYIPWDFAGNKSNRFNDHLVVWAKNKIGLKSLWKMVGLSNDVNYFYYRPRIQLKNDPKGFGIEEFAKEGNLFSFSGHQGSKLCSSLFADYNDEPQKISQDIKRAYKQPKGIKDPEYFRQFLHENWLENTCKTALEMEQVFGKDRFFIEIQNEFDINDEIPFYIHILIAECLREVSKQTNIRPVASTDNHYARQEQAIDQRILLLTNMRQTENDIRQKVDDPEEHGVMGFFTSQAFYLKSFEEMKAKFTKEELDNTNWIADQIEQYSLEEQGKLPKFDIPEFTNTKYVNVKTTSDDYLMSLAIEGAKKLKPWESSDIPKSKYWERLKEECDILFQVGLSDYFLIVQDICQYCNFAPADRTNFDWQKNIIDDGKIDPIVTGPGRGSAAGCLVSYLIGITKINPLLYGLIFSRFYNHGRNKGKYISYPDIDLDISSEGRPYVLEYLKWKYKNVSQVLTFSYMKGRSSLKDCFRVKNSKLSMEKINDICDKVGIESKIIAEIEEMKHDDSGYNTLKWTLDNSEEFQEYYKDPEIKPIIDQAVRLENTIRGSGKHASGLLLYPTSIEDSFPTCIDTRTKEKLVATSMSNLEKLGGIKIDILAVSVLDKLKLCEKLVNANA